MDKWASLITFKPSSGLDEKIYKMRAGQRKNLTKMGITKRMVKESIERSEGKK